MEELDYKTLLLASRLTKGSTVDLVIDIFNITRISMKNGERFVADNFIDAVYDYIGPEGTLLIRAFNWNFCHDEAFNIKSTPSQVGALGNVAMKRDDFKRTSHPLYSWLVKGKYADELVDLDEHRAFGPNSVFAWEHKNPRAVQLNIGKPKVYGLTLFHYMEEVVGVPYRYQKDFNGQYIDHEGKASNRTYSMYVRDLDYEIITDDEVYMNEFLERGIRIDGLYHGIETQLFKIPELCDVFEKDIMNNRIPTGVTLRKR